MTCLASAVAQDNNKQTLVIGYTNRVLNNLYDDALTATVDYLRDRLGHRYNFDIIQLSDSTLADDIRTHSPDFLIIPSELFLSLSTDSEFGVHDIAIRKTIFSSDTSLAIGSVFVRRADRKDIQTVGDMARKTVVTANTESIEDWWAAMGELQRLGFDSDHFFSSVHISPFQMTGVVEALLTGSADVGIMPTCALEALEGAGILASDTIEVINPQPQNKLGASFHCRRSTDELYPSTAMVSLTKTPDAIVKDITLALLSMPNTHQAEWSVGSDYTQTMRLMKQLKFGMYEHLRDYSPGALLKQYKTEIAAVLLFLLFLFINEVRIHRLVIKRTSELSQALAEKQKAQIEAFEGRKRLSQLERSGVISQMSNMIAHELKQPLGALLNYAAILKLKLTSGGAALDPVLETVLSNIESDTKRIASIVDSVRKFAKKQQTPHRPTDLITIIHKAVRTFNQQENPDCKVPLYTDAKTAMVMANPLALELLILNLVRNAVAASLADNQPNGVWLELSENPKHWILTVSNRGRSLSDTDFKRLESIGESVKPEGLGLGLSIVREIADLHSARLSFSRRKAGGLDASLMIEKYQQQDSQEKNPSCPTAPTL